MRVGARSLIMVVSALGAVVAGCGEDGGALEETGETTVTSAPTTAPAPEVAFTEPADGATVTSPVVVKMQATDFTIEPAGEIKAGAGHFHVMVDAPCVAAGEVIPKDDAHQHYGMAQTEAELMLPAGQHTLCLQAGDGAHTALDLTDTITVTVSG